MNQVPARSTLLGSLEDLIAASQTLERNIRDLSALGGSMSASAAAQAAAALVLTDSQRRICERVLNVFETGSPEGNYSNISIYRDGPNRIRQITYGRSQTTEYGKLRELVKMYSESSGIYSDELRSYVEQIGRTALVDDETFKGLLRRAGSEDPIMRSTQDAFFDRAYFQPALLWAGERGFTQALSALVIYDSYIHSGGILDFLRSRFPERPPSQGGDEKTWIRQYVDVRHIWLTNNDNPDVRPSSYRTRDLKREIARGNWDLSLLPFMANGVAVRDTAAMAAAPVPAAGGAALESIPYLGPFGTMATDGEDDLIWSEIEPPAEAAGMSAAAETTAAMAGRIASHPGISLATTHVSGVVDQATAAQNIDDTAAGQKAHRSRYGNAPGGTVAISSGLLSGMLALAETYSFAVSELAGGSHNRNSRHYLGVAMDINAINGRRISADHPDAAAFQAMCRSLGATEVLGPGRPGHSTHIHAAWPRTG
jgi:chitosanase